jgi:hypothetical protein
MYNCCGSHTHIPGASWNEDVFQIPFISTSQKWWSHNWLWLTLPSRLDISPFGGSAWCISTWDPGLCQALPWRGAWPGCWEVLALLFPYQNCGFHGLQEASSSPHKHCQNKSSDSSSEGELLPRREWQGLVPCQNKATADGGLQMKHRALALNAFQLRTKNILNNIQECSVSQNKLFSYSLQGRVIILCGKEFGGIISCEDPMEDRTSEWWTSALCWRNL